MGELLVTGGTGTLGRVLVPHLLDQGHAVRLLSRRPGPDVDGVRRVVGDLATGEGLARATEGIDTVVHLASDPLRADRVDVRGTALLEQAAQRSGVAHVVLLSIVGCDRNPYRYYRAKVEAERLVLDAPVGGSVLRATQFHAFVPQIASLLVHGPVALLPKGLRAQLVDLRDVSARLARAVEDGPGGRLADLAGPEVVDADEALGRWCEAVGRRVPRTVPVPAVGRVLRAFADGTNLAGPGADRGTRTFDVWLDELRSSAQAGP